MGSRVPAAGEQELNVRAPCLAFMEHATHEPGRTVVSIVSWDAEEFGILIDYGKGEWRKYRVGSRDEAQKELERIGFDKPGHPFC